MASATGDANLIWGGECTGFTAQPVIAGAHASRLCGYQTSNLRAIEQCCPSGDVQQYECWAYCGDYNNTMQTFQTCINSQTNGNYSPSALFCQTVSGTSTIESLKTSWGSSSYSAPRMGWIIVALLFAILFVDPATATIIPSLDTTSVVRRQSTSCTFSQDQVYTRLGRQIAVVRNLTCGGTYNDTCALGPFDVDTGIDNNNRTINANSAADPEYDQIFEIVGNATGRPWGFPAQTSLQASWEFVTQGGQGGLLSWAPFLFCTNGTVTNCKGVLGDSNDASVQEFCGPTFSSIPQNVTAADDVIISPIQGNFGWVTTN